MHFDEYDLSFVAPHKRDEVRARIRGIEAYIANPTAKNAKKIATEIGIAERTLHLLVRIWREKKEPAALVGSGRPRQRKSSVTDEQALVISAAIKAESSEVLQRVVEQTIAMAQHRGVALPSPSTLRREIKKALGSRLPANSFAAGADFVVDHVAVDMPVLSHDSGITMPIATIIIDVQRATIVAVELRSDEPGIGSVAFAINAWLQGGIPMLADGREPTVAVEEFPGDDWRRLVGVLAELPIELKVTQRPSIGRTSVAQSLLGVRHNGMWLKPRKTSLPPAQRIPTMPAGATPLSIDRAAEVLHERWVKPGGDYRPATVLERKALRRVHLLPIDRSIQPRA